MRTVLGKVVEKIKTHILCSVTFFLQSCSLWDNVEKCGGVRGATDDVTIWRIGVACWIIKATYMHAHAHTYVTGYPHVRTHSQIYTTYCFCTATMIRESASILRYTYVVCFIITETEGVYCAVRTGPWNKQITFRCSSGNQSLSYAHILYRLHALMFPVCDCRCW
jgi:hypothetical protein